MVKRLSTTRDYWNKQVDLNKDVYSSYAYNDINFKILNSLKSGKRILALGCGAGREAKFLVEKKNKVLALDISNKMIEKSKKSEPKAKYICGDAVLFAERNKNKLKFDYILGLYGFLGYIPKKDKRRFIENLMNMLDKNGEMIFVIHYISERWQDLARALIASFLMLRLGKWKDYEFGDVFTSLGGNYYKSHHFTKSQLRKLFRGYSYKIKGNEIYIKK